MRGNYAVVKATLTYTPTAYIHRNFQSDSRKVSRTSFLLSPYFKGFFYALFSQHFNIHVGPTRQLRRWRHFALLTLIILFTIFLDWIYKTFRIFARLHLSFFPDF